MTTVASPTWQEDLYRLLREHGITQFAYVPDAGHRHLIDTALEDPEVHAIPLSTEEEGVGVVAGAYFGGEQGVLLMQSSGVGNTINFLSLIQHCQIPFLTLVTMRGDYGEQNPWQFAMGQAVEPTLQAMGLITLRTDAPEDVSRTVEAALGMVNRGGRSVAVLLTQRLLGAKKF
ncbi:thiamine pyrophosphate-binding protein [Streptomyces sp. NPDC002896]|uniref:thiamine pyrophosphate-binding protein n=1 Tax=Streptomyces sp. NPDC002896 TaxID=3154438 RepID=UPI003328A348